MAHEEFAVLPAGISNKPTPFSLHVSDENLSQLTSLVKAGVVGAPTFYNTHSLVDNVEYAFGATRDWFSAAKDQWANNFDWRAHEKLLNSFPQFTMDVTAPSDNQVFHFHFAALFASNLKPDAIPLILLHGWPGSWTDFIPVLQQVKSKYSPGTLPYHIIVPSIPDYGLSTRSKLTEKELDMPAAAEALNELMKALGFKAYIVQGGDVGSGLATALATFHDECKAVHFNNFLLRPSERAEVANLPATATEAASIAVSNNYWNAGTGYMLEQGTKPGAMSLILESSPLALLGWIGSLFIEGSLYQVPTDVVLAQVSWYWLTRSYGRSLWAYRAGWPAMLRDDSRTLPSPLAITKKPLGYSWYPGEVLTVAKSWLEHWFPENLVLFREHANGGHFASLDDPAGLWQDFEDFVAIVKTKIEI